MATQLGTWMRTWSGIMLRVSSCVFAAGSVRGMVTTTAFDFSDVPAFRYLNAMMLLHILWSLGLACLDIYDTRNRKVLHKHALVILLVFAGDLIMVILTIFTASCASAGVVTLIVEDVDFYRSYTKVECVRQITLSIAQAFIASGLAVLSLLASFSW